MLNVPIMMAASHVPAITATLETESDAMTSMNVLLAVTIVTAMPHVPIMMVPLPVHVMTVSLELEHRPVFRSIYDIGVSAITDISSSYSVLKT